MKTFRFVLWGIAVFLWGNAVCWWFLGKQESAGIANVADLEMQLSHVKESLAWETFQSTTWKEIAEKAECKISELETRLSVLEGWQARACDLESQRLHQTEPVKYSGLPTDAGMVP